jgi:hypothetical protein
MLTANFLQPASAGEVVLLNPLALLGLLTPALDQIIEHFLGKGDCLACCQGFVYSALEALFGGGAEDGDVVVKLETKAKAVDGQITGLLIDCPLHAVVGSF